MPLVKTSVNTSEEDSNMLILGQKQQQSLNSFSHSSIPVKRLEHWPFLYYQDSEGKMWHNPVKQCSEYVASQRYVGEALL